MANFPTAVDDASSLFTPVDAFQAKPLETTATNAIGAGDSTISVVSTSLGFAAAYGILSVNDELIIYTAKTANQFTGCQRGAFGTVAAVHQNGSTVRANMVSGFLTALQSAVLAIESDLGTAAARNYIRAAGDQVVTGNKTFLDGASYGSGDKAGTGLVRLPNAGAVKWRKADDSGDLGIELNAQDHLALDAIMDFAPGQTFGSFYYPDATISSKGIVSIEPAGGLAVASGVASLAATGVVAGTYTKVSVDAKGRVTTATTLVSGDLPAHTHVATDIVSGELPFRIQKGGTDVGSRRALNLIEGARVTISATDDSPNDRVNVIVAAAAPVAGEITNSLGYVPANRTGENFTGPIDCGPYQTIGSAFENMAKYSEDLTVATWDKNGWSCAVTANATAAPDGNTTADQLAASTTTPVIQQQIAGLASGGQYTFYVWAKVASGTRKVSLAIVDNGYASYLAGPTQVTLTSMWQRFAIVGTLATGQTGLWIVVRQFAGNGDDWTTGSIHLWGACLQQGSDPKKGYARTWASQTSNMAAGVACGALVISAKDNSESPLRVYGPGSNLADHRLFEVTSGGELIIAGGTGNGYRFAELMGASNPSGWAGMLKVKNPAGATAGYILLYSNP